MMKIRKEFVVMNLIKIPEPISEKYSVVISIFKNGIENGRATIEGQSKLIIPIPNDILSLLNPAIHILKYLNGFYSNPHLYQMSESIDNALNIIFRNKEFWLNNSQYKLKDFIPETIIRNGISYKVTISKD